MRLAERILLLLSRKPGSQDYVSTNKKVDSRNGLDNLCKYIPGFMESIIGKSILDFGCGHGYQAVAMAKNGAHYVLGIDINQKFLNDGRESAKIEGLEQKVEFTDKMEKNCLGKFDIVISQNSMEHYNEPEAILGQMKAAMRKEGKIFITFGPLWFSPYGHHMDVFTKMPWVNIFFSERTLMKVRGYFRNDGATRYDEIEGGLSRMTVGRFEQVVAKSGMKIEYIKYNCIKRLNFLGKLPFIRELFINQINCILAK